MRLSDEAHGSSGSALLFPLLKVVERIHRSEEEKFLSLRRMHGRWEEASERGSPPGRRGFEADV